MDNNNTSAYYDNYVTRQVKAGINPRHKSIIKFFKQQDLQKYHNVLEIGCGIGTVSELIAKYIKQGRITSVDISPKSIEVAKNRLEKYKNIEFIAGDITDINFKDIYDRIILPDVLEHIPSEDHNKLFEKLFKLLKYDGAVYIHIPDPLFLDWVRKNRPEELQIIDQSLYIDHIVSLANKNNFYITHLESYSIWTKPIEYRHIVLRKKDFVTSFEKIPYKPGFWKKVKYKLKLLLKK